MQIQSCSEDEMQAYSLVFNHNRFGFVSGINMENLKYFSAPNQQRLGKIDIRLNISAIRHLPNNRSLDFIVMTEYRQILSIIYLLRGQSEGVQVFTTKSMLESAKIYAMDFYLCTQKINQVVKKYSYEQESVIYDNYEIQFQRDFSTWAAIFTKKQIEACLGKMVALNYGQNYDTERGVILTPYPSGINLGSAVWLFYNPLTKEKLLWIQGMSHHLWRACSQFEVDKVHSKINYLVFTSKVLTQKPNAHKDEVQCFQFLQAILLRLNKSLNTKIILQDCLTICDIINYMVYEFKQKFKKLFISGGSVSKMIAYANSYVEFLTAKHRHRIYQDQPVFPFQSFEQLKERNYVEGGSIEEIAESQRVPLKELILRSTPYIHFETDFFAFLNEGQGAMSQKIFQPDIDLAILQEWLQQRQIQKIICYCQESEDIKNIPDLNYPFSLTTVGQKVDLKSEAKAKYYTFQGELPRLIGAYVKSNGWLRISPCLRSFRLMSKNWVEEVVGVLAAEGIKGRWEQASHTFRTERTRIRLQNFKLKIESDSGEELVILNQILDRNSKLIKLK